MASLIVSLRARIHGEVFRKLPADGCNANRSDVILRNMTDDENNTAGIDMRNAFALVGSVV